MILCCCDSFGTSIEHIAAALSIVKGQTKGKRTAEPDQRNPSNNKTASLHFALGSFVRNLSTTYFVFLCKSMTPSYSMFLSQSLFIFVAIKRLCRRAILFHKIVLSAQLPKEGLRKYPNVRVSPWRRLPRQIALPGQRRRLEIGCCLGR